MRRTTLSRIEPLFGELSRFARWLAKTPHDAEEIIQETVLRILRAKQGPEPGSVRAWLFKVARNAQVDLCRRRAAHERFVVVAGGLEDLPEIEAPRLPLPRDVDPADIERALLMLPEAQRLVLLLVDLWEFDHHEAARILDIPVGTVKSRVARARARVALLLSDESWAAGGEP